MSGKASGQAGVSFALGVLILSLGLTIPLILNLLKDEYA